MYKCRKAKLNDVSAIVKVMQNTTYAEHRYPKKSFSELKQLIKINMKERTYLVCVDTLKNKIVGYFILDDFKEHLKERPKTIKINKKYAFHAGVGILTTYRNLGLATKITRYAFSIAKRRGYPGMYCDVGSDNEGSLRLQERCGFKEVARYSCSFRKIGTTNVVFKIAF